MKRAILVLLICGCATVNTTLMDAHSASLKTQAAADLSCPKEQVQVAEKPGDQWTAEGCGKKKAYLLKNPNCVVERDCVWEPQ
jgi:hypothetical protein